MFSRGQIYYLINFKQSESSQEKNRYCIILDVTPEGDAIIFHKVTSKPIADPSLLKPGPNNVNGREDIFYFPAGQKIGKKDFSFPLDSYINMGTWNISKFSLEKFTSFEHRYEDDLIDEIFADLIYFIYRSKHLKGKYKPIFEKICDEIIP